MKVLLSIKPEFAEKIFNGTKKYEFRKSIFKNTDVDTIVVYASSPAKVVLGEFRIDRVLSGGVDEIWRQTCHASGISEDFYREYFKGKATAYAIKIGNVTRFDKYKRLGDYNLDFAPQSYVYLK